MILSPLVETSLFLACLAGLVLLSLRGRRQFLFGVGFLLPLMVPRLTLAVGVDWYKILAPLAIALAVLLRPGGVGLRASRARSFGWILLYACVVTTVWIWAEYGWLQRYRFALAMGLSGAQAEYKMPVQLGSFLGQILILFIVPLWARDARDAWGAVWGFFAGCASSSVAGLVGIIFLGAGTLNGAASRGTFEVEGGRIIRIGGLSGEPKFLAAALCSVFFFAISQSAFGEPNRRHAMRVAAGTSLVAIFMTFSASAFGALALGLLVFLMILVRRMRGTQLASVLTLGAVMAFGVSSTALLSEAVQEAIYVKVFGDKTNLDEMKDAYVFYAYADNPEYLPVGFGLGGGDLAVMPYVDYVHLKYERTPTPSFTATRLFGDLGISGLAILWSTLLGWAMHLKRNGHFWLTVFTVCGLFSVMLTSMSGLSGYLFLVGAALVLGYQTHEALDGPSDGEARETCGEQE